MSTPDLVGSALFAALFSVLLVFSAVLAWLAADHGEYGWAVLAVLHALWSGRLAADAGTDFARGLSDRLYGDEP